MPKLTLLSMTQEILDSMDSDNVNSISDTVESQQVAQILKETYYEIVSRRDWNFLKVLTRLESVSDTSQPTKIKIPENINRIDTIRYRQDTVGDTRHKWNDIKYLPSEEFTYKLQARVSSESNIVTTTTDNGVPLYIRNDVPPTYWTTYDEKFIYFDSFDLDIESTVQEGRSAVVAVREPSWTASDTFIPELPVNMFRLLVSEAKSTAHVNLRQSVNTKAEQHSRRQYIKLRELETVLKGDRTSVNYGR